MKKRLAVAMAVLLGVTSLSGSLAGAETETPAPGEAEQTVQTEIRTVNGAELEAVFALLGEEVYRTTYQSLQAGEVIRKGSSGETAKGVQQTLNALGQNIAADGQVGDKTIAALNHVREAFGVTQSDVLDVRGYVELLKFAVFYTDEEAAITLFTSMESDEYMYNYASALCLKECYYQAWLAFRDLMWKDAPRRARACEQSWPEDGEIYRSRAYPGTASHLRLKIESMDENSAAMFKIYSESDELVSCVFMSEPGKRTIKLPAGVYRIDLGVGEEWYGIGDGFNYTGTTGTAEFQDGEETVTLKKGYIHTLTFGF